MLFIVALIVSIWEVVPKLWFDCEYRKYVWLVVLCVSLVSFVGCLARHMLSCLQQSGQLHVCQEMVLHMVFCYDTSLYLVLLLSWMLLGRVWLLILPSVMLDGLFLFFVGVRIQYHSICTRRQCRVIQRFYL